VGAICLSCISFAGCSSEDEAIDELIMQNEHKDENGQEENKQDVSESVPLTQFLTDAETQEVIQSQRAQYDLFKAVNETDVSGGNVVCSPMGVQFFLSMLTYGVDDNARNQIVEAMGYTDLETLNSANSKILRNISNLNNSTATCIANSLWYDRKHNALKSFTDPLVANYAAEIFSRDFSAGVKDEINSWCAKHTNNLITKFLNENPLDLVLLDALYFKSPWSIKFAERDTEKRLFHGLKSEKRVDMMLNVAKVYRFNQGDNQPKAVKLMCGGESFSVTFMLPPVNENIDNFIATGDFAAVLSQLTESPIAYKIPKMKVEPEKISLCDALDVVGVTTLQNPGVAGIFKDCTLPLAVLQKCAVVFNEEGAEGAAVTGGVIVTSGPDGGSKMEEIAFDRPFVFFIREESTGLILFAGKIIDL